MRLSVVVTTYNQPEWLEKVLWGFVAQTFRDFELLVADDGSDALTRELIDRLRPELGYPVRHIWHPHDGFRKCTILNEAIAQSEGEYLFFTDGDCIPRPDLLLVHHANARKGSFLSGGYVKLPLETSRRITKADILAGDATRYRWLRANGTRRSRRLARMKWGPLTSAILDRLTTTGPTFNGHNSSAWRDDLIAVNGFDERLEYGGLDRELGERLENAGIRGRQLRHRALVVHLDHPRGYRNSEAMARNRAIRDEVARNRISEPVGPRPAPRRRRCRLGGGHRHHGTLMAGADAPAVVVFRRKILPWSETFIASQTMALERYAPVYVGYELDARGAKYVEGRTRVLLSDHSLVPPVGKFLVKYVGRVPGRWRRAIAATRPTLVHAFFGSSAIPAHSIARALGVPLIVTYLGMDITVTPKNAGDVARRRRAFAAADKVLCVSEFLAEKLREAGCPPEKVQTHYTGVDTTKFVPSAYAPAPAQVLFVGRLAAKKGVSHLLRAMPEVLRAVPDAELLIAGDGELRGSLEAEAKARALPVRFLGVQTPAQVNALMSRATVLCGPSVVDARGNAEGLPFTFLEAQACGLPVVVSTSGGTAEGAVDGKTGFLFAPGDERALARHLITILKDPALRQRMSSAARTHMEQHFDLAEQTRGLESIYDAVRGLGNRG